MKEWLGVDFDGTLAEYHGWQGHLHMGKPIEPMVDNVKQVLAMGVEVRIFTARCYPIVEVVTPEMSLLDLADKYGQDVTGSKAVESVRAIRAWTNEVFGKVLPVTCVKDYGMSELWDDRAIHVIPNTGILAMPSRRNYF